MKSLVYLAVAIALSVLSVPFFAPTTSAYSGSVPMCTSGQIPTKEQLSTLLTTPAGVLNTSDSWIIYRDDTYFYRMLSQNPTQYPIIVDYDAIRTQGTQNYMHQYNYDYSVLTSWGGANGVANSLSSPRCVVAGDHLQIGGGQGTPDNGTDIKNYDNYVGSPPPVVDLCTNLTGDQSTMPSGYEDPDNDKVCTEIVVAPPPTPPAVTDSGLRFGHKIGILISLITGMYIIWILRYRSVTT